MINFFNSSGHSDHAFQSYIQSEYIIIRILIMIQLIELLSIEFRRKTGRLRFHRSCHFIVMNRGKISTRSWGSMALEVICCYCVFDVAGMQGRVEAEARLLFLQFQTRIILSSWLWTLESLHVDLRRHLRSPAPKPADRGSTTML